MPTREERDAVERALGACYEDTHCRMIQDPDEAKRLGVRIGTIVRERIPAQYNPH